MDELITYVFEVIITNPSTGEYTKVTVEMHDELMQTKVEADRYMQGMMHVFGDMPSCNATGSYYIKEAQHGEEGKDME